MNYQHILYSRSLSEDYRWMIIPSNVSEEDLIRLEQLYTLFDNFKLNPSFNQLSVPTLYCLHLSDAVYLIRCGRTKYKDMRDRDIYCMQGIQIRHPYFRHFWFTLPWFIIAYEEMLDVWKHIEFNKADSLTLTISGEYELDMAETGTKLARLTAALDERISNNAEFPVILPYDGNGLNDLIRVLLFSPLPWMADFAFGATTQMIEIFPAPGILALTEHDPVSPTTSKVRSSDQQTPSINSQFVEPEAGMSQEISQAEKIITKQLDDPLERFNPRRMMKDTVHRTDSPSVSASRQSSFLSPARLFRRLLHHPEKQEQAKTRLQDENLE